MGGGNDEREQTLNQILVEMDGFDKNSGIVVMAATNRPDILDSALTRPGRFDRKVMIGLPDVAGRLAILQVHARGKSISDDVKLDRLAKQTPGFSGADLENLLNEAAILSARRSCQSISMDEIEEAVDRIVVGQRRSGRIITPREKELTAYHEAGHTVAAYFMPRLDPVHKVTIMPRGQSGGHTQLLPEEDRFLWSRTQMEEMLVYAMGGMAAEELVYQESSTGASGDLQHATGIARKMVTTYGMSKAVGTVSLASGGATDFMGVDFANARSYSEETAALVDREIRRVVDEAYGRAALVISRHREKLDALARELMERETVKREEVAALLGPRPLPPSPGERVDLEELQAA